ncbi:MAG TPA: ABC transporter permease [Acidobacteriaceae bacterium]|nr:ABC transporter permease [Acidobacteriaceae bacterium]
MRALLMRTIAKLRNLWLSHRADDELEREIALHVALLEEEYQRRGLSEEAARTAARRALGGIEQARQAHRDQRSILWLEQTRQDLRHACRTFARNPGFAMLAVVTLALGIGVNTTLFTAYDAVALKPLPVADAARVVRMERWFVHGWLGDMQYGFSWPEYLYCREHQGVFSDVVAASSPVRVLAVVSGSGGQTQPKTLEGQLVSGNYFRSFGVDAGLGRTFGPDEDRAPGADPVVVLSYAFWQREFHGDSHVIGKLVKLNGAPYSVIGVAPQEFTGTSLLPRVPDFWAPASMQAQLVRGQDWLHQPADYRFQILARLKPEVGLKRAEAETAALIRQFSASYVTREPTRTVTLEHTAFFGNTEDPRFEASVAALMLIVAMVLFVACANVANMLLARGAVRQREISVRLALGASRSRVIRQLITESVLLSLMGGVAGLALSVGATRLLRVAVTQMLTAQLGSDFVFSLNLNPDARVLAYALVLSVVAGVVFGLSPALQFSKPELATSIRDESTSFGHRLRRSRLRSLLIGGQVAISMLLLTCSGLLVRGLMKSQNADPGFDTRQVFLLLGDYGDNAATSLARFHRLFDRLQDVSEVASVSYGRGPMMGTWAPPMRIGEPGSAEGVEQGKTLASYASRDYLKTLGIALLRGRDFTRQETTSGAQVAIVSEAAARRFWPGEDALGKHFQLDLKFTGKLTDFEVVGIAQDVRFTTLTRIDPAHVYLAPDPAQTYPILINVGANQQAALPAVWKAVNQVDADLLPDLSLWNVETMLVHPQRTLARVMAIFAVLLALLALSLAGVGIYGVMAYVVSQRTQEIGIRMALGARASDVLRSVALRGLTPVAAGMAIGLACGAAASAVLHSTLSFAGSADFLYGVRFYDPWTFAGISCFLVVVSLLASLVPAVRAVRVDPMIALRYE